MCNDKIVEVLKQVKDLDNQKIFLFADTLEKKSKLRNLFEKTKSYASVPCYPDNELTIKKIVMEKNSIRNNFLLKKNYYQVLKFLIFCQTKIMI